MFERFNPPARAVVVRAQEQARLLDHGYIGTEHLLLGLLAGEPGSVAADVLQAQGVTHEQVRTLVLDIVGPGEGTPPGHIPFTPRSKKVLELSLREALKLRHKDIGPEHILLGLVREGEGLAAQILTKLGAALPELREQVVRRTPVGPRRGRYRMSDLRMASASGMTAGAVRATDRAATRAAGGPVGSQHYLLGLLDDEESLAARALAALGVKRETIEAKLAELGTEGTSDEPPAQVGARATSLQVVGDVIAVRIEAAELAARLRAYFELTKKDVLRGVDLPGADRLWKVVHPALEDLTRRVEQTHDADWTPPGWAKAGVATFAMVSKASGFVAQLWCAEGVDREAVRRWLADWLTAQPPGSPEPCVFFTAVIGRAGDVVPDAEDPDAFRMSHWSCGAGPAPAAWPRVPIAELVSFAIAHLNTPRPEPEPPG